MSDLEHVLRGWDGLATVVRHDALTDAWIFIALHDDSLGRPMGGTRMKVYPSPADGLRDAHRLAEGMTHKWAAAGVELGGGKAVLALSRALERPEREGLLRRYGRLVESLGGSFSTGQDLGTTPEDMATIAGETRFVHGRAGAGVTDPGPFTARGVFAAVGAVARGLWGGSDLTGRRVLIQGVGDVGEPLARHLREAGAELVFSDVDEARAEALAAELGATTVSPSEVYGTPCDVFAPCAIGGVLNSETVPKLACRAVCGSANNQVDRPEDADLLHGRDILYAPDYIANSGGAIAFSSMARGVPEAEFLARIDGIGRVLDEVFAEAEREGRSPLWTARRRVERMLDAARHKA
ncbi:MAG: Glu/Leu/Phe/Val dehydrogenase dimerization domain-containing protein, partial [Acidobacteriota bacterium]